MERSHFLAWMGVIAHRHEYANPAISDLYYLHEYVHAAGMRHGPDPDWARWSEKIWNNERDASLGSEVFVYFDLPDLRPQTFSFEIWADRFLADPATRELYRHDRDGFVRFFEGERARAMREPRGGDANEALIASYHALNVAWADIWRDHYLEVETQLEAVTQLAKRSRAQAAARLGEWLREMQGDQLCPFEEEARLFAATIERARLSRPS